MLEINSKNSMKLALNVLKVIERHTIDNPIKGHVLAEMFNTSWRTIADVIEILRDCGYKVGSNKSNPMGYFIARNPEELLDTTLHMEEMAKKILSRINKMRKWDQTNPTIFEQEVDEEI